MNKCVHDVAIVIPSCDKYGDLWPTLFQSINKFWPDLSFPIYLITNYLEYNYQKLHALKQAGIYRGQQIF